MCLSLFFYHSLNLSSLLCLSLSFLFSICHFHLPSFNAPLSCHSLSPIPSLPSLQSIFTPNFTSLQFILNPPPLLTLLHPRRQWKVVRLLWCYNISALSRSTSWLCMPWMRTRRVYLWQDQKQPVRLLLHTHTHTQKFTHKTWHECFSKQLISGVNDNSMIV